MGLFFKRGDWTADSSSKMTKARQEEERRKQDSERIMETLRSSAVTEVTTNRSGVEETRFVFYIPILLPKADDPAKGRQKQASMLDFIHKIMENSELSEKLIERVEETLLRKGYHAERGSYDSDYPRVFLTWSRTPEVGRAFVKFVSPAINDSDTPQWKASVPKSTLKAAFKFIVELNSKLPINLRALQDTGTMQDALQQVYGKGTYSVPVNLFPRDKPSVSVRPSSLMGLKTAIR